ncbi:MAG: hypothetical protein A4E66_00167 [Syntrophus sp. PtaB.Bin001]|nr:MAG: hypothetical protein A4E66_00167 [Syntrophus sp. PtaB.Bin001]
MADNQIKMTIAALDQTRAAFDSIRSNFKSLESQSRSSVSSISSEWKKAAATIGTFFSAYQAASFVKDVVGTQVAFEGMTVAMESALGSSKASADSMAFLRAESQRLGLSLEDQTKGYVKIAAAAKGTALEGEPVKEIFTAIAEASTALKLSGEETQGALLAISQMMSKGKVSAEELRGQLGERLPGAFQVAAKAMGVTTGELDKMLQGGKIMAEDFLPKFSKALREHYSDALAKASQSTSANINRMKTAIFDFKVSLGEAFGSSTQDSVNAITTAMTRFREEISKPEAQEAIRELSSEFAELIVKAGEEAPEALRKVLSSLRSIMTFYDSLPGWLIEAGSMGLVGKILFGNKVGVILASISAIKSKMEELTGTKGQGNFGFEGIVNLSKDIKNLWSGKGLDGKYVPKAYRGYDSLDTEKARLEVAARQTQSTSTATAAPAPSPKTSPSSSGDDKAAKKLQQLQDRWKDLKLQLEADISTTGMDDFEKKLADVDAKAAKYLEEFKKVPGAADVIKRWAGLAKIDILDEQAQKDLEEYQKGLKEVAEQEKENAEEAKKAAKQKQDAREADINAQLTELDLAEQAGLAHRETLTERLRLTQELLDMQMSYLETLDKEKDPASWYSQLNAIKGTKSKFIELKNANQEVTGSFTEGWIKALKDWNDNAQTAFTAGREMARQTAQAMQDSFAEFFFDVLEGKFSSLHDYIKGFATSVNKILANTLAKAATDSIVNSGSSLLGSGISLISSLIGGGSSPGGASSYSTTSGSYFTADSTLALGQHKGGVGKEATFYRIVPSASFFGAPRYHSGIGPGERAAIIRNDEGVFTPGQMKNMASLSSITEALRNSGSNGGNSLSVNVPISINSDNKAMIAELKRSMENTAISVIRKYS